jgi:hypothetical protein
MRNWMIVGFLLMSCESPKAPQGESVSTPPQVAPSPERAPVPREKWKVTSADAAKVFLQSCSSVKEGSLLLTVEQEATPEYPLWWIGLQIKDGPLLDRCSIDAETQELFCRGDTCP